MAISPCAAARLGSIERFLDQVEYNGRRLAKCNLSPDAAGEVLRHFDEMLEPLLQGRFGPSLEQLQWATLLALERAYYRVREEESQALFGIYRAGAEVADSGKLSQRLVRLLAHAFRARAGGLLVKEGKLDRELRQPLYIEQGTPEERWIADPALRGRYASYWSYPLNGRTAGVKRWLFRSETRPGPAPAVVYRARHPRGTMDRRPCATRAVRVLLVLPAQWVDGASARFPGSVSLASARTGADGGRSGALPQSPRARAAVGGGGTAGGSRPAGRG